MKLARVLSIHEGGHMVRPGAAMARMAMESGAGDVPISPGELKVEAMVTLVYEVAAN